MPTYEVTDSVTGRTLSLTGDSPPTDAELAEIFDSYRGEQSEPVKVDIPEANSLALGNVITADTEDEESKALFDENEQQRQQMLELASTRFPAEVLDTWKDNPIGFGEAGDFLDWSQILPGGGIVQGAKALNIVSISKKIERGEQLTPDEDKTINEFIDKQLEMSIRGMNYGGQFRYYGEQMPAFMAEFALTGGVGKAAQAATVQAITKGVARSALQQTAARQAGRVARVAAQTAAMVPMSVKNYGDQRLGPWAVSDKGQILFKESKDSPASSALKALAYTSVEVASELSGATLNKYLISPVTNRLKTPLVNAVNGLPEKLKLGLFEAYKKIKPNARISEAFTRAGWNGMIAELGEERVADILRETVNLTLEEGYTFDQVLEGIVPSKDQLLLEAGLIGAFGGVRGSANIVTNLLIKKGMTKDQAEDAVSNMNVTEQEAVIDEALTVPTALEETMTEIETGVAPIRAAALEAYDQYREGVINSLLEVKNKTLKTWTRKLNAAKRANTKLARVIAKAGGINVESLVAETGFDRADLRAVNKRLGATVFRVDGGKPIDQIQEIESEYWDMNTDMVQVLNTIEEMIADPTLPAYQEKQAEEMYIQREVDNLTGIPNLELEDYYNNLEREGVVDLPELETLSAEELEQIVDQDFPRVTQEEFEANVKDLEAYIETEGDILGPGGDSIIESQTDAVVAQEPTALAPQESIFNDFYYRWFDSLGAFRDLATEAMKRGLKTKAGRDLRYLYRAYAGVVGMSTQNILGNTFYIDRNRGQAVVTGKGLKSILEDFDNSIFHIESNKANRKQDLIDYLIARRYYNDLQMRPDVEVTDQQKIETAKTLDRLAVKYGDGLAWFDSAAKELYDYQTRMLDLLVRSGNMSQETFDKIQETNQNYIPFQRVLDEEFGEYGTGTKGKLFTNATINKVIKRIVGSEKEIKDPIQSIIKNTFRIVDLAWQNRVAQSIASMAPIMEEYIEPMKVPMQRFMVDGKPEYRPSQIVPKDAIIVFEDGKKKFYRVHPALIKAMEQMQPEQLGFVTRMLQAPATLLRAGATLIPEFWARNVLRDMQSSFIQSPARPIPIIDPIRGLASLAGRGDLHTKWMQAGGSFNSYMELSDNGLQKAQEELLSPEGKIFRYLKNPLNLPYDISLALEQSVRIGVFNAAKKKGASDLEAAFEARDATLDFARGGTASKIINRYIPFFNAGMQGADKLFRSMRDHPKATVMWATATITLPSVILAGYYLYAAPEDEREEYAEIPQWQKDMFWVFKSGDTWMRYPKPFSLGYIFGSVPERFLNWMGTEDMQEGQKFWLDIVKGIVGSVSPIYDPSAIIPPLVKVTIENVANYNFFQGRPIYPDWMDDLPPEERRTKGTSQMADEIGQLLKISPAKIDNALRGQLAGSAQYITDASDFILNEVRAWNGEEIPARPTTPVDDPLIRAFTMRYPTGGVAESTQTFYDSANLATQVKNKLKNLKAEERAEYRKENEAIIRATPYFESSTKVIRKLNKRRNLVYENLVMTGEEKEKELRIIDDMILARAKQANERYAQYIKELEQ